MGPPAPKLQAAVATNDGRVRRLRAEEGAPYEGNPDKLGKAYGLAKMDLDMCWGACKKGLFAGKEEPFRKFVQSLSVTPM